MLLKAAAALVALLLVAGEDDESRRLWAVSRGLFEELDAHPTEDSLAAAEHLILDDGRRWLPVSWRRCGAPPERDYVVWAQLDVGNLTRRLLCLEGAAAPPPHLLTSIDFVVSSAPAHARSPDLILKTSRSGPHKGVSIVLKT